VDVVLLCLVSALMEGEREKRGGFILSGRLAGVREKHGLRPFFCFGRIIGKNTPTTPFLAAVF